MRDWAAWCRSIQAQAASNKAQATRVALLRAISDAGAAGISTVRLADAAERSRTTVRDTCRALAAAGMIERAPTFEQGFAWRLTERAAREIAPHLPGAGRLVSLGEQPHSPAGCHKQGWPHAGPCVSGTSPNASGPRWGVGEHGQPVLQPSNEQRRDPSKDTHALEDLPSDPR